MQRLCVGAFLLIGGLIGSAEPVIGQSGGSSSDRFVQWIDKNRDGVIDRAEMDQMPGRVRDMLESGGVRLSQPMRADEFADMARRRFEALRAERASGGSGSDRSRDDDDDRRGDSRSDQSSDRYRSWGRSEGSSSWGDRRSEDASSGSSRGSSSSKSSVQPLTRERVTFPLPEPFVPGDSDFDGQIGLYEWKTWKGRVALAEFQALDHNHDGFLTPRELVLAAKAAAESPPTGTASGPTGTVTARTPAVVAPSSAATSAPVPTATPSTPPPSADGETAEAARRYFALMDGNRDGRLSADEWGRSRRIRPLFEQAGIDLSQSMGETDFVNHYVGLSK